MGSASSVINLPVAVLAGGRATRLLPLTTDLPKSLIPVAGRPFIEHQLRMLRARGFRRVVLCVGHFGAMIERTVGDGFGCGLKVEYSYDGSIPLGTGGALKRALPLLGDEFCVLYGDSYLPIDYAAVAEFFDHENDKLGCMTIFHNEGRYDRSNVVFCEGEVKLYDKRHRDPQMHHIDYGLSIFRAQAFEGYPSDTPFDLGDLMQDLVRKGQMAGYEVIERFYEIGSHEGLAALESHLSSVKEER